MEDVKTIDIGGVQWNIKDQEARNDIITLKAEVEKLRTIEKWEYNIPIYGGKIIARRQGNTINIVGTGIGRDKIISKDVGNINFAILPERFRPKEEHFYIMRISGSYLTQYGGMVQPNGNINFWTYVDVDYGCFSLSYIVD